MMAAKVAVLYQNLKADCSNLKSAAAASLASKLLEMTLELLLALVMAGLFCRQLTKDTLFSIRFRTLHINGQFFM